MDDYRVYKPDRWETALGVLLLAGVLILIGILFYDTPLTVLLTVILIRPALKVYSDIGDDRIRFRFKRSMCRAFHL